MNILYHCSEYPPYKNGGIGTATKIVAEEMSKRGHTVFVVGYYTDIVERKIIEKINGVTVIRLNYGTRRSRFQKSLFSILNRICCVGPFIQKELTWYENNIERIIEETNIDIFELTDYYPFNHFNARLTFKKFSIPTVLRVHGSASFLRHYRGEYNKYITNNDFSHFKRTDYLCSVSFFSEKYIIDNFPECHFKGRQVIYNPVENSFLCHNFPSNNKVILYIGKLIETKGAFSVIKAFNQIAKEFPEWSLRMAGMGNINDVKKLVSADTINRVSFLGFCGREVIAREIDNCTFACIPTYFENFSMVPLEILGRTRTMIFTERTSGKEIIRDGVDGYVVNPEDIEDLCNKIRTLITNNLLRDNFAEQGYNKVVKRFTVNSIIPELEKMYNRTLDII